jgi:hypothetical protein
MPKTTWAKIQDGTDRFETRIEPRRRNTRPQAAHRKSGLVDERSKNWLARWQIEQGGKTGSKNL